MTALWLRVRAPFAAFRWPQAGDYHATSPIVPPAAARGLILNLAHIDGRHHAQRYEPDDATDSARAGVLRLCIAVGQVSRPGLAVLHQWRRGGPVRREVLVDLDCVIGVRDPDPVLLDQVIRGVRGQRDAARCSLLFAGESNFLMDRIDVLDEPHAVRWYGRVPPRSKPPHDSCRLTVAIVRDDSDKSTTDLFAPMPVMDEPPESAWTWCPRAP